MYINLMERKTKHKILIYGGLGDLAYQRIIPALNRLSREFPLEFAIVDTELSAPGKYYQSGKEPLSEYNVAIISTPNDTHQDIAIKALKARLHILCEKPIAHTLKAAKEILKAAEKHTEVSMLSDHYVYKPVIREIIRNWERYEGQIGKLKSIEARIFESSGVERREWLLEKVKSGGGVAMDTGIHLVSIVGKLFGYEKINVSKAVTKRDKDASGDAETYAYILLHIEDMPVEIEVGKYMTSTCKDMTLIGNKGRLEIDIENEQVKVNGKIEASFPEDDSYLVIMREFFSAIESNGALWTTLEEGYKALKIISTALLLSRENVRV